VSLLALEHQKLASSYQSRGVGKRVASGVVVGLGASRFTSVDASAPTQAPTSSSYSHDDSSDDSSEDDDDRRSCGNNSVASTPGSVSSQISSASQQQPDLLVRLFDSDFFNEWIALEYLYKSHSPGVHDYICNKLYTLNSKAVEKYLSQLCNLYVAYRPHLQSLERAIVDLCAGSISVAVKAYWLLSALVDDHPRSDAARAIKSKAEQASISGTWKPPVPLRERLAGMDLPHRRTHTHVGSPTSPSSSLLSGSDASEFDGIVGSPRARQGIFGATLDLVYALCEASAGLAAMPYDERQGALQRAIDGISDVLQTSLPDVVWPMGNDVRPRQVVNIVAEESVLLNSREKAPFMVFVEVIGGDDEDLVNGNGDHHAEDEFDNGDHHSNSNHHNNHINNHNQSRRTSSRPPPVAIPGLDKIPEPPSSENNDITNDDADDEATAKAAPARSSSPHTPLSPRSELSISRRIDAAMAGLATANAADSPSRRSSASDYVRVHMNVESGGDRVEVVFELLHRHVAATSTVPKPTMRRLSRQHHRMPSAEALELLSDEVANGMRTLPVQRRLSDRRNDEVVWSSGPSSPLRSSHNHGRGTISGLASPELGNSDSRLGDKLDTTGMMLVFGERSADRKARIRATSPHGSLPGWDLRALIVKSGDDVRQELLAMQLLKRFAAIFRDNRLNLWVRPYEVLVTGCSTGFIEVVPDALSIHQVKTRYKRDVLGEDVTSTNPASIASRPARGAALMRRLRRGLAGSGSTPNLGDVDEDAGAFPHVEDSAPPQTPPSPTRAASMSELLTALPAASLTPRSASGSLGASSGASTPSAAPSTGGGGSGATPSLRDIYLELFGPADSAKFRRAQRNFVQSLAGYSIICYVLNIRDRHNGNIMLDRAGHILHIDFGFMLTNSPGGVSFETAPFKLVRDYMELMDSDVDGKPSELFEYFKVLVIQGFLAVRKHAEEFLILVEMMSKSCAYPCFKAGSTRVMAAMRKRFHLGIAEDAVIETVLELIDSSCDAWRTRQYDQYQYLLNGVLP